MIRPGVDYTDKDFDSLRARLRSLIESVFPDWTEENVVNFGNMLLDMFAFVGDVLLYYQDNQAAEARIGTAKLRKVMLGLVRLVGYVPAGQVAALHEITLTLASPPVGSVTVQAGDTFSTLGADPVKLQVLADVTFPAAMDPPTMIVEAEHSRSATDSFQATGRPRQTVVLSEVPFLDGSLSVSDDVGAFTVEKNFLTSGPTDRHVTVSVDESGRATLTFGSGVAGVIPSGTIVPVYKVGGGADGNVDPGSVQRVDKSYSDSLSNPVKMTVSNGTRTVTGADRQSLESIRERAPASVPALSRSVARPDFEAHALKLTAVGRALMLSRTEKPSVAVNQGKLVIIPRGGGTPSDSLLAEAEEQVRTTFPHMTTFVVNASGATFKTVDVLAWVHPRSDWQTTARLATLSASIRARLVAFFAVENEDGSQNDSVDFGYLMDGSLAYSDVYDVVRDTTGVRKIDDAPGHFQLNGASSDVDLKADEFPQLGTVTLINAITGAQI